MWPVINDVQTGATPEYPDIQPQTFPQPPDATLSACRRAVGRMPRLTLGSVDAAGRRLEAVYTTRLLRFRDDVSVWVEEQAGGSRVQIRSRSRVGKGDLGQNARTIRALQALIADELR